ncbi:MAG: hypothetical protein ACREPE_13540 [Lysobacter sp.]
MKNILLGVALSLALLMPALCRAQDNAAQDKAEVASQAEGRQFSAAFSKSIERLIETHFDLRDRRYVIRRHRGFIVVSCLNISKQYRVQMHLVYDPLKEKIVHELGEQ